MKKYTILLFLLLPLGLLFYNIVSAQDISKYFETPLYAIINIFIAVLFAYFLTQHQTDRRREIDFLNDLIKRIIVVLENQQMIQFDVAAGGWMYGYTQHEFITQRFDSLGKHLNRLSLKDDLSEAKNELENWWIIFSEVMADQDLANECLIQLHEHIKRVIFSLEKIQSKIFK
jgi:hypothetical protein